MDDDLRSQRGALASGTACRRSMRGDSRSTPQRRSPSPAWIASLSPPLQPGVRQRLPAGEHNRTAAVVVEDQKFESLSVIAKRPSGVGVEGAPTATSIRRRRTPFRQTVSVGGTGRPRPRTERARAETFARRTNPRTRFPSLAEITASQSPDSPTTASLVAEPNTVRGPTRARIRSEPGASCRRSTPARRGNVATRRVQARRRSRPCRRRLDGKGCQHRGRYSASSNRSAAATHPGGSGVVKCTPPCRRLGKQVTRRSWPASRGSNACARAQTRLRTWPPRRASREPSSCAAGLCASV